MSNYICKLHEQVERTHVRYQNRYGIAIAGDLYTGKDLDKTKTHAAIVVGAPYGGVKEQGPSVYANELAKRGFVVLTFDPCYMGESGGEPRHISSPDLFSENISAGVDYPEIKLLLLESAEVEGLLYPQRQWIPVFGR